MFELFYELNNSVCSFDKACFDKQNTNIFHRRLSIFLEQFSDTKENTDPRCITNFLLYLLQGNTRKLSLLIANSVYIFNLIKIGCLIFRQVLKFS